MFWQVKSAASPIQKLVIIFVFSGCVFSKLSYRANAISYYSLTKEFHILEENLIWRDPARFQSVRHRSWFSVPLEVPLLVIKWTDTASLNPSWNAMEVKSVIADTPRCRTIFYCVCYLVSLTLDARLVNVILADRTVLDSNILNKDL